MIYRYVFSEWRSIRPMQISQYDITMVTHYDIIMAKNIDRDAHFEGNDMASDIHCDVTMSNDVAMCIYRGITMHRGIAMDLFYYVFSALCLIIILIWEVWNKNKNKFIFDQSGRM